MELVLMLLLVGTVVAGIAGFIGNIMLIVHAFNRDETGPGVAMILAFVVPFMYLYTLYYMATRWDGTRAFKFALGGPIFGLLYAVLTIVTLSLVPTSQATLVAPENPEAELRQMWKQSVEMITVGEEPDDAFKERFGFLCELVGEEKERKIIDDVNAEMEKKYAKLLTR